MVLFGKHNKLQLLSIVRTGPIYTVVIGKIKHNSSLNAILVLGKCMELVLPMKMNNTRAEVLYSHIYSSYPYLSPKEFSYFINQDRFLYGSSSMVQNSHVISFYPIPFTDLAQRHNDTVIVKKKHNALLN